MFWLLIAAGIVATVMVVDLLVSTIIFKHSITSSLIWWLLSWPLVRFKKYRFSRSIRSQRCMTWAQRIAR